MKPMSFLLIAAAMVVAAGCSKTITRSSGGKEVSIERKGDQVNVALRGRSGDQVNLQVGGASMELPADFPTDVPIFPKAVVRMTNTQARHRLLALMIPASVADGLAFYQGELKKQGWTVQPGVQMGGGYLLQAGKGARTCSMVITLDGKDTVIQLTITTAGR
jgi:hypothetical protein